MQNQLIIVQRELETVLTRTPDKDRRIILWRQKPPQKQLPPRHLKLFKMDVPAQGPRALQEVHFPKEKSLHLGGASNLIQMSPDIIIWGAFQ